jgi:ribonuclease VapC
VIVIDASALVSILAEESDADGLLSCLERHRTRSMSTISVWEAACAVASWKGCIRQEGFAIVDEFIRSAAIAPVAPDMTIAGLAVAAAERYGRGAGRPGILNLGDCFSYATAKHLGAALLFKGDDFGCTDIEAA